jgi:hypothetical protein
MDNLKITAILIIMFFIILVSIQYTLNKMLVTLKEIRQLLAVPKNKKE